MARWVARWVAGNVRPVRTRTFDEDDVSVSFSSGEPDALRLIYERHQRAVYSYCQRFVADQAADVTQEVFLAAWRSRERFDPDAGSLIGWIMGIARFKVADQLRRQYRNAAILTGEVVDLSANGTAGTIDPELDQVATRILVAAALEQLQEPTQSWVRQAFIDGLSHSEIATRSGAPLGTVKSSIRRALLQIRRDLEAFDVEA